VLHAKKAKLSTHLTACCDLSACAAATDREIVYYTRGLGGDSSGNGTGAKPPAPILFLHGVGGLVIYLDLIKHLARLGGPMIAVDIRHVGMRLW
jgi:hypothetical protein